MSFSKRKPYSKLDMSLKEFFNAPVRHLKDLVTVESALEKPYRWDFDYPAMHIEFPPFPDWELEPWHPWDDEMEGPYPEEPGGPQPEPCLGCAIVCRAPYPECEGDPIWCHAGIWCGADLECDFCSWEVLSGGEFVKGYWKDGKNFYVSIDTEKLEESGSGEASFFICMTDPLGHICCDEVEVDCDICDCDTAETFAWDSAPPDTLTEGGGWSTISVTGGCGPYTFSLSDGGFDCGGTTNWSLLTSGPVSNGANSISIVATASCCCLVTVTDACGSTVEQLVRNARGSWVRKAQGSCEMSGPATWYVLSAGVDYFEYLEDYKRQIQGGIYRGGGSDPGDCCDNPAKCTSYTCNNCLDFPFNFRDGTYSIGEDDCPCECVDLTTGQYRCWELLESSPFMDYYEWEC